MQIGYIFTQLRRTSDVRLVLSAIFGALDNAESSRIVFDRCPGFLVSPHQNVLSMGTKLKLVKRFQKDLLVLVEPLKQITDPRERSHSTFA
jgi:hypothetical protein